jgi:hypothetical protein
MTRGRKPLVTPTRSIHLHIDDPLMKLIDERLWSEAEQRVPKGAYQAFFTEAVVRMLRQTPTDLSPYTGSMPLEHIVFGFEGTTRFLRDFLERIPYANHEPRDAIEDRPVAGEGSGRDADGGGDDRGDQALAAGSLRRGDGE